MRKLAIIPAALALAGCAAAGIVPTPPPEFRGDRIGTVYFTETYTTACVKAGEMRDWRPLAQQIECYIPKWDTIVLPNPCKWRDPTDGYAKLACHSMGHANGAVHGPDGGWLGWEEWSKREEVAQAD